MSEHVETLRAMLRVRKLDLECREPDCRTCTSPCGSRPEWNREANALTAAIEALEPPQDTAELHSEVKKLAEEAFPDCLMSTCEHTETLHEAEVSYAQQADGEWHGYNVAAEAPDERTALLMLRGALRARLGR